MSHIHLKMKDVSFIYEENHFMLKEISFTAKEHESIGIIGANGAGKSTLLKILVGLNADYKGEVLVEDMPVVKSMYPKIRERVGYVFQDSSSQLFMPTVYEELAFGPRNYGFSKDEVEKRVNCALDKVHIAHLRDRHIYKLSGGEQRLVAIATVLSMQPDILLMDEPSIALDPANRRNLIKILKEFHHLKLIASHDLDMIGQVCERVILLDKGKIVADGNADEILANENLLSEHGL